MKSLKLVLVTIAMSMAGVASATSGYDVTSIQTSLTDVTSQILLVGIAVLTVFVGVKAYKWIRKAL